MGIGVLACFEVGVVFSLPVAFVAFFSAKKSAFHNKMRFFMGTPGTDNDPSAMKISKGSPQQ
jgi:hypothetical protein